MNTEGDRDRTVLVVDDEAAFAESVALWLREHWTVEVANSGEEALDAYGPEIDAVLLDRRMPQLSGDDVLAAIRERDGDACVGMMTAVQPDWDILEMDIDRYVKKPVTKEEVVEATQQLLSRSDYADELRVLFALSEKVSALRANYTASELESDERFQHLRDEIDRVRSQANDQLRELDDETVGELTTSLEDV